MNSNKQLQHIETNWDEPLSEGVQIFFQKFVDQVSGNPITTAGDWSYNPDDPWTIFTDASDIARGAVLFIGETKVEDVTKLRKKDDRRHINVSELQAVRERTGRDYTPSSRRTIIVKQDKRGTRSTG